MKYYVDAKAVSFGDGSEDGALVLVDYKTDSVKDPAVLQERYRVQLELYERALVQSTGKPVKERWIYSFALQKEIPV